MIVNKSLIKHHIDRFLLDTPFCQIFCTLFILAKNSKWNLNYDLGKWVCQDDDKPLKFEDFYTLKDQIHDINKNIYCL